MNYKTKNTKAVLFASLIAMSSLLFGIERSVYAENYVTIRDDAKYNYSNEQK